MPVSFIVLESYLLILVLVLSLGVALDVDMANLVKLLVILHVPVLVAAGVAHFVLHMF